METAQSDAREGAGRPHGTCSRSRRPGILGNANSIALRELLVTEPVADVYGQIETEIAGDTPT